MKKISRTALALTIAAVATPVFAAKPDCHGAYKAFMGKATTYIDKIEDVDLATLMRRGLSVYDACQASDNFVPQGAWNQVIFDMEAKAKK